MPQEPALITTTSIPQQPQSKYNMEQPAVRHYEQTCSETPDQQQQPAEQQQTSNTNTSTLSGPTNNLENNKDKTPICLINDLARYNKIQHQYQLTGKKGPAHRNLFTIVLKLGNEEYEAEGASLKKAQHSAAAIALQQTQYKQKPLKTNRNNRPVRNGSGMVPPTVELNAIVMKRGEKAVYILENGNPTLQAQGYMSQSGYHPRYNIYGPGQPDYNYYPHHNNSVRNDHPHYENCYYGQYQHYPREPFFIRLRVGKSEYSGIGQTVQAARHDAALTAIQDIQQKEMDNKQQCPVVNKNALPSTNICNELNTELQSPISLVHEIALKRNVDASFEVLGKKGSANMNVFVTQCRVGDLIAEGEGNGKKISKKRAAEKMLEELSNLGPHQNTTNLVTKKRKCLVNKKKQRNIIKVNSNYNEDNPISRLIQIQQAKKEKNPVYNVIEVRGPPRCCEFEIEASVSGYISTGVGSTKKIAKRNAAEDLLALLGYTNSSAPENTPKPVTKTNDKLGSSEMCTSSDGASSTTAPQVCHGEGPITETSHEKALEEVYVLSELSLDNISPNKENNTKSVHEGSTAKPQVVPKAGQNQNRIKE